jgi:hypothetical protein
VWGRNVRACARVSLGSGLSLLSSEEVLSSQWRGVISNCAATVFQVTAKKATFDECCMAFGKFLIEFF